MSTILPGRTVWPTPALPRRMSRRVAVTLSIVLITGSGVWLTVKHRRNRTDAPVANIATVSMTNSVAEAPAAEDQVFAQCSQMLLKAKQTLAATPSIEALFCKQERIDGTLQPQHIVDLKQRREPMCVYMRWHEPDQGQEVLYQEGAHEGQLLVHPGGWKGKLLPMVKLDPNGDRAMSASRRPVTAIGPWNMTNRLIEYLGECEDHRDNVRVAMTESAKIGETDCYCFRFTHLKPVEGLEFKEVVIFVDKAQQLPIAVQNYGWPAEASAESHLEESYVFDKMKLNPTLTEQDFSHENPSYGFGAQ